MKKTDVKEILSHIDYLMSNHDSSLDYEAALEDVRSFILEREKGDHIVYKHGMVEPAEEYAQEKEKEPIDDDIEKAVDEYLSTYFGSEQEKQDWPFLKKMAIHFANWQKQQDKKGLELLKEWFEDIAEKCEHLTSGNVSHNGKMIRGFARNCAEYIKMYLL